MFIKVYHSFGSEHNAIINGHIFANEPVQFSEKSTWFWSNIKSLLNLFRVKTVSNVPLVADVFGLKCKTVSKDDGYFHFEFDPKDTIPAGWHALKVYVKNNPDVYAEGKIFFPYKTSHAIISDIDDTVLKSYSATIFRRMYELLSKNPNERKLFDHTVDWYKGLAASYPPGQETHPFFYVSSSEWNLYNYLDTVFKKHELPEGIFLLNQIKTLSSFFKTGKTGHQGKITRIQSLMKSFPEQKFILIGDNTQRDPYIYQEIAENFPNNIIAVFVRNKKPENQSETLDILKSIEEKGIKTYLFDNTLSAIRKSKEWGLIVRG